MKIVVLASLLVIVYLPEGLKNIITIILSIGWLIYTIYYSIKLFKIKDSKAIVKDYMNYPPNNNYAPCIRYLYKSKVDEKVFISTILELLQSKSISIIRQNKNEYYFIDNKLKNEDLTKNEIIIKRILFKNIGSNDTVSLNSILNNGKHNSKYLYELFKEWQHTFLFETAKYKYFKPIKPIIDSSLFYFVVSMTISLYNVIFTKYIVVALIIFYITSYLIIEVNNYSNREEESKEEYKNWLRFKNYIRKEDNNLSETDNESLEIYAIYAYILDEYDPFVKVLNKKYSLDKEVFNNSVILSLINFRLFDDINDVIKKSIKISKTKSVLFFLKNKGRSI